MLSIATAGQHATNDIEISDRGRIYIEDRDRLRTPERNEIESVKSTDDTDHVNVLTSLRRDRFIVVPDRVKLFE